MFQRQATGIFGLVAGAYALDSFSQSSCVSGGIVAFAIVVDSSDPNLHSLLDYAVSSDVPLSFYYSSAGYDDLSNNVTMIRAFEENHEVAGTYSPDFLNGTDIEETITFFQNMEYNFNSAFGANFNRGTIYAGTNSVDDDITAFLFAAGYTPLQPNLDLTSAIDADDARTILRQALINANEGDSFIVGLNAITNIAATDPSQLVLDALPELVESARAAGYAIHRTDACLSLESATTDHLALPYEDVCDENHCTGQCLDRCENEEGATLVCTRPGLAVLTFDDGPSDFTPQLLEILEAHNATAAFYVTGQQIFGDSVNKEERMNIMKAIVAQGSEVANHSFNHPRFTELTREEIQVEVVEMDQTLAKELGIANVNNFRPPYGDLNNAVIQTVAEMGRTTVLWNTDLKDFEFHDTQPEKILETLYDLLDTFDPATDSVILLQHDTYLNSILQVPAIIDAVRDAGFTITTMAECLGYPIMTIVDNESSTPWYETYIIWIIVGSVFLVLAGLVALRLVYFKDTAIYHEADDDEKYDEEIYDNAMDSTQSQLPLQQEHST
eukprot:Clim_evm128s210 gene=Clim_evmTU128s210